MKKLLGIIAATTMALSLVACGESKEANNEQTSTEVSNNSSATTSVETTTAPEDTASTQTGFSQGGTITLNKSDIAVVVNGTSVPMPYRLADLESAGVPADESRSQINIGAGDIFSANLSLDENGDYLLIPAYQNKGDASINITEAEAEDITMTTYADVPEDQGVSILGVPFGMTKSELKAKLGEPAVDDGDYFEWHLEIPEMSYEGTLFVYVTSDADDAGVSQVNMTVFEK